MRDRRGAAEQVRCANLVSEPSSVVVGGVRPEARRGDGPSVESCTIPIRIGDRIDSCRLTAARGDELVCRMQCQCLTRAARVASSSAVEMSLAGMFVRCGR